MAVGSLAALPFESWSSDTDDASLGLGLADALITRITELKRLAAPYPVSLVINADFGPAACRRRSTS